MINKETEEHRSDFNQIYNHNLKLISEVLQPFKGQKIDDVKDEVGKRILRVLSDIKVFGRSEDGR